MAYRPRPIDVSGVELDPFLRDLVERLAQNTHDVWSSQRLADGWTMGPTRDDAQKTHPCLIAYEDLPESEKKYDRVISETVIKAMLRLGYSIHPPLRGASTSISSGMDALAEALAEDSCNIRMLRKIWAQHNQDEWSQHPELNALLGGKVLRAGEPLLAFDILSAALEFCDESTLFQDHSNPGRKTYIDIQQKRALALAQSGAPKAARHILQRLQIQDPDNGETSGIYGRTCKDIAMAEKDELLRHAALEEAFAVYYRAYIIAGQANDASQAYYNGINAATLSLFLGETSRCLDLAKSVKEICLMEREAIQARDEEIPYWVFATLGEADLLLGNLSDGAGWYRYAVQAAQGALRDISSMKKQATAILNELGRDPLCLEDWFHLPSVISFTGHMIDSPSREKQRFPPEIEDRVRNEIALKLDALNAGIAYASAACGSDIIFLEEMLKRGGEIHVVLPFEPETFIHESVDVVTSGNWRQRFEAVLQKAASVSVLGEMNPGNNNQAHFEFANLFLLGAGIVRGQMLGAKVNLLAVWDGERKGLPGGTSSTIRQWQSLGHEVSIIQLPGFSTTNSREHEPEHSDATVTDQTFKHHTYLPMLFADVKGYSTLTEQQVVNFSIYFLDHIHKIIANFEDGILSKRTQGDGLFLVFKDISTALNLSIALNKTVAGVDWTQYGLPEKMLFRVSLDAGPCYSYIDPIVNKLEFCGDYVVRAARMEPITPPGEIYASETFVALARATGEGDEVQFDYAGQVSLPKNFGIIPVYHVREK